MAECTCEHCHRTFEVPDSMIVNKDKCPARGRTTKLPAPRSELMPAVETTAWKWGQSAISR